VDGPDAPMADIIASCWRHTETLLPRTMDGVDVKDTQVKSALGAAKKILNAYKMILRERAHDGSGRENTEVASALDTPGAAAE